MVKLQNINSVYITEVTVLTTNAMYTLRQYIQTWNDL